MKSEIILYLAYDGLPKNNQVNCSFENPPPDGKVCGMDELQFAPCNLEKQYGYNLPRPCIFLKLNKVNLYSTTVIIYL